MSHIVNPNLRLLHKSHKEGKRGAILEGSSRCFAASQKVITENGSKPINQISIGEKVLTPKGFIEVSDSLKMQNTKKCLRITLKNGSVIECTEDHEFFFKGTWHSIKDIVSLWNGRNMETNTAI